MAETQTQAAPKAVVTKPAKATPKRHPLRKGQTKSDWARERFAEGMSISAVEHDPDNPGMGYAFLYGIAQRAGVATKLAARRATKTIQVNGDSVTIALKEGGSVTIDRATGKVTRSAK